MNAGNPKFWPSISMIDKFKGVGWLRFELPPNNSIIRVALFEASQSGEPLEFSFIWGNLDPKDSLGISTLVEALVNACAGKPYLLVVLEGDLPKDTFQALNSNLPICIVRPKSEGSSTDNQISGFNGQLSGINWDLAQQTTNYAILSKYISTNDPFELLERSGKGLAEVFAQPFIQTLSEIPGLQAPISLLPNTTRRINVLGSGKVKSQKIPINKLEQSTGSDFPASLWKILAKPPSEQVQNSKFYSLKWAGTLLPFQKDGVHALMEMDRLLLSDDMGLGKTVQVIAALRILSIQKKIKSSLIVTPASILDQWRQELNRWAPEMSGIIVRGSIQQRGWQWRAQGDFTLVSYDTLRQDERYLADIRSPENPWDVVVLDEAQKIKNRIKTSEIAKKVPRLRSWALTGTPIENHENELASIIEFVDHVSNGPRKRYHYGKKLIKRHQELQLRRKKTDVLQDLPPKIETKLTIPLHPDQRKSYDKAEYDGVVYLKSLGSEVKIQHVLELIVRLKQICNADPITGASSKLENISDRLQTLTEQGHRALVFSQYKSSFSGVGAAAKYLSKFNPLTLTGDIPVNYRQEVVNQFKTSNSHKALIISLKVGGLGLNLQEASYVFHLDRWWNPAVERQAEDRSHRFGQKVKVNVIKYSCQDTIEERIDLILNQKQALFDTLIDDVSLDLSSKLNRKELFSLFGLN